MLTTNTKNKKQMNKKTQTDGTYIVEWKNIINSLGFLKPWHQKSLAQTVLSPSTKIKFQRNLKEDLNLSLWETISTIEMSVLPQINDLIYHLVRNGWLHSFRTW